MSLRTPFYDRLPEIYRIRDAEQFPPDQLRAYLRVFENAFGAIHENIEALYHDLFIEHCDDWVIPYLADLLGTTHLRGDPWTLRADVADTIALRRRKGTLIAIERLAANLTGWTARPVELRENLVWTQHLNHLRPDAGGVSFYSRPERNRFEVPRGGTVPVRDPAMLSLLGTPFSGFAHTVDVKPATEGTLHYNLPNLAIFLWRLEAYRIAVSRPVDRTPTPTVAVPGAGPGEAPFVARFDLHPLGRPVRLFNTGRAASSADLTRLTPADEVPGPMPDARLTTASAAGNPTAYIQVDTYTPTAPPVVPTGLDLGDTGLQLYLPQVPFAAIGDWRFRGDNLCGWEPGLRRPVQIHEIVIDPDIGRLVIGVDAAGDVDLLRTALLVGFTYGAVGAIGAHPVDRGPRPATVGAEPDGQQAPVTRVVNGFVDPAGLTQALADARTWTAPVVIEIQDSLIHELDLASPALLGTTLVEDGGPNLLLGRSLVIRAADGQRPIIRLARPLRFRPRRVRADDPVDPFDPGNPADTSGQPQVDAAVRNLLVRFEGVYLVAGEGGGFAANDALVMRAAVARFECLDCTLDPGGFRERQTVPAPVRAPLRASLHLTEPYGFANAADEAAFAPTPDVVIQRSIVGALGLDEGYALDLEDSVVDAGAGPGTPAGTAFALGAATAVATAYSAPVSVTNVTFFGRVRATSAYGRGAIFGQRLEVLDHQRGCLKFCWFSADGDVLPPNYACVDADEAHLVFTSTWFADPGYAQLSRTSDRRILTRGPGDEAMGATNFLFEAHKWTNLAIRLREFMPVGVRPLVVPVT